MDYHGIEVEAQLELPNGITPAHFNTWLAAVLAQHHRSPATELTCVITDDAQIQVLNLQYRAVDEPTDVLAFSSNEGPAFVTPEDLPPYLGDIIISLPAAERQAAEVGHSLENELALLTVHGCLHLLGYDHTGEEERAHMWQVQDQILLLLEEST